MDWYIILTVIVSIITGIFVVIAFKPEELSDWVIGVITGVMSAALVFCLFAIGHDLYEDYKHRQNEIAYCAEKIANGGEGWNILITDKYTEKETRIISAGKTAVPITTTVYYVSYRVNEIGSEEYDSRTVEVDEELFNHVIVRNTYKSDCTLLDFNYLKK